MNLTIARRWFGPAVSMLAAMVLVVSPTLAADEAPKATLKVGDPAPKLSIAKWLKGEPVKELEKGKIYVMEFWATWCGPCIAAMPHVSKLQQKYADKGIIVIGVNVWEQDPTKVEPFVTNAGDRMAYRVATEVPIEGSERGRMATDWLQAAGQQGIPFSMIVDRNGIIAWTGHPMSMDRPLASLAAGTFDPTEQAEFEAKLEKLEEQANDAMKAKEYDKAIALTDQIAALDPSHAAQANVAKLSILTEKEDWAAVTKLGMELTETAASTKDGALATRLAGTLLMVPATAKLDPAVGLKAAELANELGAGQMANQRLLAQAYAKNGKFDKAVEVQEKVVSQMTGFLREREKKVLEEYKSKIK